MGLNCLNIDNVVVLRANNVSESDRRLYSALLTSSRSSEVTDEGILTRLGVMK
jgi:hypothetical protein